MSSSPVFTSKIFTLLLLYLVQGIPYGFQSRFLPIYLRTQGMSLTSLGIFKVLLIPWALKVLWAPLVDRYATKRIWLLASLAALALTCFSAALITPGQLIALCLVVFCLNLFASTQDIAVDGIAIQILSPEELGAGNTVQVVGYKIGAIFGGGLLVWLIEYTGWSGLFTILAAFYALTMLAAAHLKDLRLKGTCRTASNGIEIEYNPSPSKDQDGGIGDGIELNHNLKRRSIHDYEHNGISLKEDRTNKQTCPLCRNNLSSCTCQKQVDEETNQLNIYRLIVSIVQTPYSVWTICYVLLYKLGEQGAVGMLPLFLVDHGIPVNEVTMWTGVIGQGLSIAGSLCGGWLLSNSKWKLSPQQILPVLFVLRLIPMVAQTICVNLTVYTNVLYYGTCISSLCLLQLTGGAITTSTFTLMMQCSQGAQSHTQATHYTALATMEVMGKLSFMAVIGGLTDWVGYGVVFGLFIGLSMVAFPLLKCRRAFYKWANTECKST